MNKATTRILRKAPVVIAVAAGLYFVPLLAGIILAAGALDVARNRDKTWLLFSRYFLGNGMLTWMLAPFNLLADLACYRNRGVYALADLPPSHRAEIDQVLDTFRARRNEIIARIDESFPAGRRGMYTYRWYGKVHNREIAEFNRDYRFIKTIAVSVFSGRESTTWHFGPLRLTLRLLCNLTPVDSDRVFIQVGDIVHHWRDDPIFIFDDTLFHRSVNDYDARRYCVFMDIARPTRFPVALSRVIQAVAALIARMNRIFYRNWKMIGPNPADLQAK